MNRFIPKLAVMAAGLVLGAAAHAQAATTVGQSYTYAIEPTHTFVTFEVRHFGTSTNRGRFDKKGGTVQFDRDGKTGKADITIDTTSINTGTAPFDKHLKSKDFLKAEEFPEARFVSDAFVFQGNNVSEVKGNLTLAGQTRPVTLKANHFNCYISPMLKREVCGGDFETTIKRSEFGSTYGAPMIPDEVRLLIQVEAIRQ